MSRRVYEINEKGSSVMTREIAGKRTKAVEKKNQNSTHIIISI